MDGRWFSVIEMSTFLGIPLAWGVWELVKLRREQARDRKRERERDDDADPPAAPR